MKLDFDVLVLGGSLEGCVAAAVAADSGKQVVLIENSGSLGGMATNGLWSYFPSSDPQYSLSPAAKAIKSEILRAFEIEDTEGPMLYNDQRMKVVLAEMLLKRGVTVLTHVFLSSPIVEGSILKGFNVHGKTGNMALIASWTIDATDCVLTAGCLDYDTIQTKKAATLAIKMNGADLCAIIDSSNAIQFANPDHAVGNIKCSFSWSHSDRLLYTDELVFLGDKAREELIIHGLKADVDDFDPLALSSLQMSLRQGAYRLLTQLRKEKPGFSSARIIHVAQKIDLSGLRCAAGALPYVNLILCNEGSRSYDNNRAMWLGARAASKLTSSSLGGIL